MMLPREHGSWAMLAVPPLTGLAAAGGAPVPVAGLFLGGLAGAFLLRTPLAALVRKPSDAEARRWGGVYALVAASCMLPLILLNGLWGLALLAVPGGAAMGLSLWFGARKMGLSSANEILGAAALSLGAPAAHYCATGAFTADAWSLWALNALFFAGPVFHVKMVLSWRTARGGEAQMRRFMAARRAAAMYHASAAGLAAAGGAADLVPWAVFVPFAGVFAKVALAGWRPPENPPELRAVGYREVGWSVLFLAVLFLAY